MDLFVELGGTIRTLYAETIDLRSLGQVSYRRASYVEPDGQGFWWVDLRPVSGPRLGPFELRTAALSAEELWLETHWLPLSRS